MKVTANTKATQFGMKSLLALTIAAVGTMVGVAHAQDGAIKDPERTHYYEVFKGKRVVFVPVFMGLDLTEGWSKIMTIQAKRLGYNYEVRNANFDTSAGVQILTQLLNEKPKPDVDVKLFMFSWITRMPASSIRFSSLA